MKTSKFFLLFITVFFFGQFSTIAQEKKVALTTFWVSKHISFDQLGNGAGLAASIASLAEDPNFNLQPVLDNFYKTFTEEYSKQFPFALLPENEVLDKPEYQNYVGRYKESEDKDRKKYLQQFLTPKTYKPMHESFIKGDKSNQMQMVNMFKKTADGVMFVSMGYSFVKKMAPFTAGIRAFVRIKIWNKEGKRVLTINEGATSKKSVPIVAGVPVMKVEKLLPMCEDASARLVNDLNKRLKKITKKVAKKL